MKRALIFVAIALAGCASPHNNTTDGQVFKLILPSCVLACRSDIEATNTRSVAADRETTVRAPTVTPAPRP